MGKITTYPEVTGLTDNQVLLVDGDNQGTKTIKASNAANYFGQKWSGASSFGAAFDSAFDDSTAVEEYKESVQNDISTAAFNISAAFPKETATGQLVTTSMGANGVPMKVTVHIDPIQEGTGNPAPDNVRNISGFTSTRVTRCGKNLVPIMDNTTAGLTYKTQPDGGIRVSGTATANTAGPTRKWIKPGVYTLSGTGNFSSTGVRASFSVYNGTGSGTVYYELTNPNQTISGIVVPEGCSANVYMRGYTGATFDEVFYVQLEEGAVKTEFEAPQPDIVETINFPAEAGTVYGGEVIFDYDGSVKLRVTHGCYTFTGEEPFKITQPQRYYVYKEELGLTNIRQDESNSEFDVMQWKSSHYPRQKIWRAGNNGADALTVGGNVIKFLDANAVYTDLNGFKSFLATQYANDTPMQLWYPFADPVVYNLDAEAITSLLGNNTVMATSQIYPNTGDVTVEFPLDPNLYADNKPVSYQKFPKETISGSIAHFTDGSENVLTKIIASVDHIQEGTGDPSPENVRPIQGRETATIYRNGVDIYPKAFDPVFSARYILFSRGVTSAASALNVSDDKLFYLKAGVSYHIEVRFPIPAAGPSLYIVRKGAANYDRIATSAASNLIDSIGTDVLVEKDGYYSFWIYNRLSEDAWENIFSGYTIYDLKFIVRPISSSSDDAGSVADSKVINVEFPEKAGTVYGGTLTINEDGSGELSVTKQLVKITGSMFNGGGIGGTTVKRLFTGQSYTGIEISACDTLTIGSSTEAVNAIGKMSSDSRIFITPASIQESTTADEARSALDAALPMYCVLSKATPDIYKISAKQITTILGTNNIFADCGDITVTYGADPGLYVDKRITASKSIIASVETAMVATKTYATGDMLIVGDDLYKATAAITPDETIAVGTNVVKTTVAEQLIALASS